MGNTHDLFISLLYYFKELKNHLITDNCSCAGSLIQKILNFITDLN